MGTGTILLFGLGAVLLVGGAELLVRGASRLALTAGIPPLAVGLTVVAFGTSSPELAVTAGAAWEGRGDVALGNVVGSNVFNVLVILGLSALLAPLVVKRQLVRRDVPIMIGATALTWILALDGRIGRIDGAVLLAGMAGYTLLLFLQTPERSGGGDGRGVDPLPAAGETGAALRSVALALGGLVLLVLGARWLVDAAVKAATALGVSELVIGLTIVGAGTSLPELATSALATVRGERDLAVGNVVGSNIFNLLAVLATGSLVADGGLAVPAGALTFDLPVMTAVAVATLPVVFTGRRIARWEGAVFVGYYAAYTGYLLLRATDHPGTDAFAAAMLWFVLPLTALTAAVVLLRPLRGKGRS